MANRPRRNGLTERAEALWQSYRDRLEPTFANNQVNQDTSTLSAFDRWQQQSAVVTDSEDGFKAFTFAPPSRLPMLEGRQMSVVQWWAQPTQRKTFPALSQLASSIDVLSAFAMSAESERTFSKARRTTSWERSQLSANTIKCSELLKDWLHRGIAYTLPTDYIDSDQCSDSEA